ncbi:MAG: hypothetical protein E7571_00445 [Ruminococcaceae bacterium]|nr:hypothetical protein [Oscillospiraceae bacterium]
MKIGADTSSQIYVSSEVRFYTMEDLKNMLGWSKDTIVKLFNDPKFPSSDFGREKVVEAHALIDYFSSKHTKRNDRHWN